MAPAARARRYRRLAALEGRVARGVARRAMLRDRAAAGAMIRAALAARRIAPASVWCLRYADEADAELAALGDDAALRAADAVFAAADAAALPDDRLSEEARALAELARPQPPDAGASLLDWYAWALAQPAGPPPASARGRPKDDFIWPDEALPSSGWSTEERNR